MVEYPLPWISEQFINKVKPSIHQSFSPYSCAHLLLIVLSPGGVPGDEKSGMVLMY